MKCVFPLPKIAGLEKTLELLLSILIEMTDAQNIIIKACNESDIVWYRGNCVQSDTMNTIKTDAYLIELPNSGWIILQGQGKQIDKYLIKQYCSQVIENAIQYDGMHKQALIDSLTGLPNRSALIEKISQEVKRQNRFGVLFLDVDGFKIINDTYGHLVGDKALQRVASSIKNILRDSDFVARYGGDEFVVVLCESNYSVIIRRLRNKKINIHEKTLTFSVGLARYPQDGRSVNELIALADSLMYKDKQKKKKIT